MNQSRSRHGPRRLAVALLAAAALAGTTAQGPVTASAGLGRDAVKYCPAGDAGGFKAKRLVGLRLKRAERVAGRHDCVVRVARRDGEWLVGTSDYNVYRINVIVVEGEITRIYSIG